MDSHSIDNKVIESSQIIQPTVVYLCELATTDANAISRISELAVRKKFFFERPDSEFVELLQPCLTSLSLRDLIKETSGFLVASPSLLVPLLPHRVVVTTL